MSGASGQVLAALHVTPEAAQGGPLARIRTGDVVRVDAVNGQLAVLVPEEELLARENDATPTTWEGSGRELFATLKQLASPASAGGGVLAGVRP